VLFATSLFAATLAFHQTVNRYLFVLGRERVLRAGLGTGRAGTPVTASRPQRGIGLATIGIYPVRHLDPMVQLCFWLGTNATASRCGGPSSRPAWP
jgi:hypothetical protein